jgi:archaeosine synthase
MVSVLRILDLDHYKFLEKNLPVSGGQLIATTNDSLTRPEIVRFRNRVRDRYKKPPSKKILLLLPCSAKKPYSSSKTHRIIRSTMAEVPNRHVIHEVVITSPLGVVPKDVELFYPAQQYDIPVTRCWSRDEINMIQGGISLFLKKNRYDGLVVHLPGDYEFVWDILDEFSNTCIDSPLSTASLEKLKEVLTDLVLPYEKISGKKVNCENMDSFARFQFGIAGEKLVKDTELKGRYPNIKIIKEKKQIGMLVGGRGMISLTLEGAKILAGENSYRVKIHDFEPKGSIFAVGVKDADDEIRIGDDVVVLRDDELVGIGVAQMNPDEMVESNRGEAVNIRHLAKLSGGEK